MSIYIIIYKVTRSAGGLAEFSVMEKKRKKKNIYTYSNNNNNNYLWVIILYDI